MKITIMGNPVTKKNSQEIAYKWGRNHTKIPFIRQSTKYREYEALALPQLTGIINEPIEIPVNLKCVYYRDSKRRVDLGNLLACSCDVLVKAGILKDDNFNIVASHDGSTVRVDRLNPRVEIEITAKE